MSSPAVVGGVVYIGGNDNLYALNAATGAQLWSFNIGGTPLQARTFSSPAVVNGVVYIGSEDAFNIYALNAATGAQLWSFTTGSQVESSPTVVNGVLYVGSNDHNVYALGVYSGPISTLTPTSSPPPSPSPTPSVTNVAATTDSGATVNLLISGNITSTQMSNITIATNPSAATTTISFSVTGESGTTGFSNITIPISALSYGDIPTIYIDGQQASNQGYTLDSNNYYVWYTTQFSTHQISVEFTTPSTSPIVPEFSDQIIGIILVFSTIIVLTAVSALPRPNINGKSLKQ